MKILGYHIVTDRDLTRMVQDGAASLAERRAVSIARRYVNNDDCLREAVAAHQNVPVRLIIPGSMLLAPMRRAIEAYADAVSRARGERAA